jgi:hypothetical protein
MPGSFLRTHQAVRTTRYPSVNKERDVDREISSYRVVISDTQILTSSSLFRRPQVRKQHPTCFASNDMAHLAQMSSGTLPSVQELFSLAGKTAIVTGGTGGLGLAMSIALAEAGADIVSIQIPNDPRSNLLVDAMKELGRKLQVFETDVADSAKLRQCFANIWEAGVVPDILLNCAGINRRSQVENFTDEDIDAVSGPESSDSTLSRAFLRHEREAQKKEICAT